MSSGLAIAVLLLAAPFVQATTTREADPARPVEAPRAPDAASNPSRKQPAVLSLEDALRTGTRDQPQLRGGRAQLRANAARVAQAKAGYLPKVDASAQYQRSTGNFVLTPSFAGSQLARTLRLGNSLDTFNYYLFGATAVETIYDFGKTGGAVAVARAAEESSRADYDTTEQSVALNVRNAYFNALAAKELVNIGEQTVANQGKHVNQIRQFVEAGTRPKIDLASSELNLANAELSLVRGRNTLYVSKVLLNAAMGIEGPIDYDVKPPPEMPVAGEEEVVDAHLRAALDVRPEIRRIDAQLQQVEAQRRVASSAYYPALVATANISGAAVDSFPVGVNAFLGVGLAWNLFTGFGTDQAVAEAEANYEAVKAQRDSIRQSIRSELEQQLLAVDEAKRRATVSDRAVANAGERLKLAEGRYEAGAGDVLELDDAQITDANAKAQRVQAQYDLAIARARLARALGRE